MKFIGIKNGVAWFDVEIDATLHHGPEAIKKEALAQGVMPMRLGWVDPETVTMAYVQGPRVGPVKP